MSHVYETDITDRLNQAARVLYLIGFVFFAWGLWIDWQNPGQVIFGPFVVADEPYSNSGLFIAAIAIVLIGAFMARVANYVAEKRRSEARTLQQEDSQEWIVDIQQNK